MTAVTLLPVPLGGPGVGKTVVTRSCTGSPSRGGGAVVVLYLVVGSRTVKPGGGFVGWEPHSGRKQSVFLCGVSYRPISTGQLHESLVLASTSGLSTQWSGWGPLTHECVWKSHLEASFPLRCFQRLSHPNVANQRCTWQYN
jgi:hypothetical protein